MVTILPKVGVAHLFAVGDQSPVDLRLFALEVAGLGKGHVVLEEHVAIRMGVVTAQLALKGIHKNQSRVRTWFEVALRLGRS